MRFFKYDFTKPVDFHVCGNLISKDSFLHMRRCFNENVLILVKEGTLYISQQGNEFSIEKNNYIILRAGDIHFGYKKSIGKLSYLWAHFNSNSFFTKCSSKTKNKIAESGTLLDSGKAMLLFNQLLDIAQEKSITINYKPKFSELKKAMVDYALSLVLLELVKESTLQLEDKTNNYPPIVIDIMHYINVNYSIKLSIKGIASNFNYNPEYISTLFKDTTGVSIVEYINKTRIQMAKMLLANYKFSIEEISYSCGFADEKYFMRVFKKIENMTPTEYSFAFYKKEIN